MRPGDPKNMGCQEARKWGNQGCREPRKPGKQGNQGCHECQEAPISIWIDHMIIMQFMRSSKLNLLDNARHLNLFLSKRASLIAAHNTSVEVQTWHACQHFGIRCRANNGCWLNCVLSQPTPFEKFTSDVGWNSANKPRNYNISVMLWLPAIALCYCTCISSPDDKSDRV